MNIIIKISAVALIAALCTLLIKSKNTEQSFMLGIAAAVVILTAVLSFMSDVAGFLKQLIELSGISSAVFAPVLKCMGIAVITKLSCELCKDAGQAGIASAVEYAGAVAAVYTTLPLLRTTIQLLVNFT